MLRDEAFYFYRLAPSLSAPTTPPRLLDVKFHAVERDFYGAASEQDQATFATERHPRSVRRSRSAAGLPRRHRPNASPPSC